MALIRQGSVYLEEVVHRGLGRGGQPGAGHQPAIELVGAYVNPVFVHLVVEMHVARDYRYTPALGKLLGQVARAVRNQLHRHSMRLAYGNGDAWATAAGYSPVIPRLFPGYSKEAMYW